MNVRPQLVKLLPAVLAASLSACTIVPPTGPVTGASAAPRATAKPTPKASTSAGQRTGGDPAAEPSASVGASPAIGASERPIGLTGSAAPSATPTLTPAATPTPLATASGQPSAAPTGTPTPAATATPVVSLAPFAPPADLAGLTARYALPVDAATNDISVAISGGTITGRAPDAEKLAAYQAMLPAEWGLYPPELIKKSGLTRLVLCEGLAFGGQARAAVPDPRSNALYLDVAPGSPEYRRAVLHHEYFHMVDYADDRQLYTDATWAALNRAGFVYDRGGAFRQERGDQFGLVDDEAGFLTYYATAGVEEDKAETFCFLMLYPAQMDVRAAADPIFAAKLARLKALMQAFVPSMDAAYWTALAAHRAGVQAP